MPFLFLFLFGLSLAKITSTVLLINRSAEFKYLSLSQSQGEFSSVQFSRSVMSDSCDPMNHSTPGLPVRHQLLESTQTHVHWVSDAIQPSHSKSSPSPPALKLSQHQSLFKWVSSSHQVAKALELQLQNQFYQWTPRTDLLLGWTGWISLQSKGLSRVFSNTTVQKHQFFSVQLSL